ncbi:MAG TPA: hypothetical protein VGQ76_13790 [Thermoanaerobaculia bacterium]|jgi:hypothetical protein|nr:hypothetical protein [Thermoanaerobaculia bacterium]
MKKIFAVAAITILTATVASADVATGTLTVTGTVESSINLIIETPAATSGTGTDAVTAALGNVNKYGAAPTGFTIAQGASDWTLSSSVDITVDKSNLTSTNYTLTAQLGTAPDSGIVWKLNGSTLSESAPSPLTITGAYGSTDSYDWDIVVADAADEGAIDNAINFTATSN